MQRLPAFCLFALLALFATLASAQPADPKLEEARVLFEKGNELRRAGDCAGAVDFYLRARALAPRASTTNNAAFCLDKLGRFDEALELYEELAAMRPVDLGDLQHDVTPTRVALDAAIAELKKKVGNVEVIASADAAVVIDTRVRGRGGAVFHVLPGPHAVRVTQDGYATFEASVRVAAGETVKVTATLVPSAGTIISLATCEERLGRVATA